MQTILNSTDHAAVTAAPKPTSNESMTATTQTGGAPRDTDGNTDGDTDGRGARQADSTRLDVRVMGPVGGAHFLSHYLIFLLPPILPLLKEDFGVGYAALGLIMTVFNIASGLTHVPMGFLVDKIGARRLLLYGVVVSTITYVCMGAFAGYGAFLVLAAIAGVANSVYHPADYALLSASIPPRRMGRAFSLHTFAGFAGGAMAPPAKPAKVCKLKARPMRRGGIEADSRA